jgi:hypothetical protein
MNKYSKGYIEEFNKVALNAAEAKILAGTLSDAEIQRLYPGIPVDQVKETIKLQAMGASTDGFNARNDMLTDVGRKLRAIKDLNPSASALKRNPGVASLANRISILNELVRSGKITMQEAILALNKFAPNNRGAWGGSAKFKRVGGRIPQVDARSNPTSRARLVSNQGAGRFNQYINSLRASFKNDDDFFRELKKSVQRGKLSPEQASFAMKRLAPNYLVTNQGFAAGPTSAADKITEFLRRRFTTFVGPSTFDATSRAVNSGDFMQGRAQSGTVFNAPPMPKATPAGTTPTAATPAGTTPTAASAAKPGFWNRPIGETFNAARQGIRSGVSNLNSVGNQKITMQQIGAGVKDQASRFVASTPKELLASGAKALPALTGSVLRGGVVGAGVHMAANKIIPEAPSSWRGTINDNPTKWWHYFSPGESLNELRSFFIDTVSGAAGGGAAAGPKGALGGAVVSGGLNAANKLWRLGRDSFQLFNPYSKHNTSLRNDQWTTTNINRQLNSYADKQRNFARSRGYNTAEELAEAIRAGKAQPRTAEESARFGLVHRSTNNNPTTPTAPRPTPTPTAPRPTPTPTAPRPTPTPTAPRPTPTPTAPTVPTYTPYSLDPRNEAALRARNNNTTNKKPSLFSSIDGITR